MTRKVLIYTVALVLIASCIKEAPIGPTVTEYPAGEKGIMIKPSVADGDWNTLKTPSTKALADLTDKEVDQQYLEDHGFGLYAYYTAKNDFVAVTDTSVHGVVFNKRKFLHDDVLDVWKNYQWDGTDYSHVGKAEFWPTSSEHKLSFFAFAPWDPWYDDNLIKVSSTYDSPYIIYDDFVAQDLSASELEGQQNLLWGTNTAGMPHKNVTMSSYDPEGTVDMHFRHAPAKVRFTIQGTLAVTPPSTSGGNTPVFDSERGAVVTTLGTVSQSGPTTSTRYVSEGTFSYRAYQYRITEYTVTERQDQDVQMKRTGVRVTTTGKRYLVDNLTMNGFNKTGTLLLNNASAYEPTWIIGNETLNYTLNSSNVLSHSLRADSDDTIKSNLSTYTGITDTPKDMMSGYYLYALPKVVSTASPAIDVSLTYKTIEVNGTETVTQTGPASRYRTRTGKRYFVEQRRSTNTSWRQRESDFNFPSTWTSSGPAAVTGVVDGDELGWTPSETEFQYSYDWSDEVHLPWSYTDVTDWTTVEGSGTPYGTPTATYTDTKTLTSKIVSSFVGGSAYTINFLISGDKIELIVVPNPWDLEDEPAFTYDDNINRIIQYLDYDSAFIDYEDGGNVYINNRMGKFYFQLDEGKYISWKASLEGAPGSFGFTDENGQWIMDGENRATSIGGPVDPNVMNYIYVKAVDTASPTTNRAKLRIRGTDSNGDDTVLLNLVNNENVVEWTIVQNAQ